MESFTITTKLTNEILAYLGSKPYSETNQLISAIQTEFTVYESSQSTVNTGSLVGGTTKPKKTKNIE